MKSKINPVIDGLVVLQQDVPKNIQDKITSIITLLQRDEEFSILKSRVLSELEDLDEQNNLESYTRTQLLNVVSLLEEL